MYPERAQSSTRRGSRDKNDATASTSTKGSRSEEVCEAGDTSDGLLKMNCDSEVCTKQSLGRVTALVGLPSRSHLGIHLILD
jgi:hypothetical protein